MPSSADEAFGQEHELLQRKDSLRQPTSKKQKKKAKKLAAAVKTLGDQPDDFSNSEVESTTPPVALLSPPAFREERLLSSSPEGVPSELESRSSDTPPIFAQEIHDEAALPAIDEPDKKVEDGIGSQIDSLTAERQDRKRLTPGIPSSNGVHLALNEHAPQHNHDSRALSPSRATFTSAFTKFTPPSPSPLSQRPHVPDQSPTSSRMEPSVDIDMSKRPLSQGAQARSPPHSLRETSATQDHPQWASMQPAMQPCSPHESQIRSPPQSPRPSVARPSSGRGRPPGPDVPPPPHMNQRHFNRIPDGAFGLHNGADATEIPPGTDKYYCGFDTLDGASSRPQDSASNVLLIGSEGALEVFRYNRNRRELIGRIEGLRGSVIDAKILPVADLDDPLADFRPLIACIVHGPSMEEIEPKGGVSLTGSNLSAVNSYQTTVEVLSVKRCKHIATLFRSAPQFLPHPVGHPLFTGPSTDGSLVIAAVGKYIAVASGVSGEVFVFAPSLVQEGLAFRCIGKYWTKTREHIINPQPADGPMSDQKAVDEKKRSVPIFALSRRWLVLSPPTLSSSQKSIDGQPTLHTDRPSPPGVNAYVSPSPPAVDCEVDGPSGHGLLGWVTKQATNEIRKGAQWVGEQGMSAIKGYWARSPSAGSAQHTPTARKSPTEESSQAFPPTHGQGREQPAPKIEPALVSVFDLDKLGRFDAGLVKSPLSPLATFSLTTGCSFLSFSPCGLALLTTNQIGDASTVWDLMRITDDRAAVGLTPQRSQIAYPSGVVRKAMEFTRVSPSSVVDVRWTNTSNRLGILTSRGTLHLHELPRQDPLSAALRSPASPAYKARTDLPSPSTSPQELPSGWIGNVRSGWQNVSGRITAIRSASESGGGIVTSTRQSLNQASVAARYASGRAVRNGYNTALEGAYSLRHSQDNKIRLRSVHHAVRPGCFRWLSGKDEGLVSTVADGTLCTYTVRSNYHVQGKRTIVVLDASRKTGPVQTLPGIAATRLPPAILGLMNPDGPHGSCARSGAHGFWTLNRDHVSPSPHIRPAQTAGSFQQDKETCPQYLPLHRLKQVTLYTYKNRGPGDIGRTLGVGLNDPWCFGEALSPVEKVAVQQTKALSAYDAEDRAFDGMIGHMEDVHLEGTATSNPYGTRDRAFGEDLI